MGYTLSKAPDSERYTRLEQRKRMRVLDVEESSDHEEMEGVVSETGVACQASVVVVDGECQTCSDFMDEHKRKMSVCCSRQLTNIFTMKLSC